MFMNTLVILNMMLDRKCIKLAWDIHKMFSKNSSYRMKNLIKAGLNVIKNDRIVKHEGMYIVNSFMPPLNSKAYRSILMAVPGEDGEIFTSHTEGKRKAPISIYISATSKCMYNCWHCSAAKRGNQHDIDTERMIDLVKKIQDMGTGIIGFTGGEPLLRDDLEEIISHIDQRSVAFVFSTGYGLTYERAKKLKASGLLGIAISLDSLEPEEHDRGRGFEGAYNHAIEAICHAKKAGLYTMVQTVCTKELLKDNKLYDFAVFMKELGVDEMRMIQPLPCGKLDSDTSQLLTSEEERKLIDFHIQCNHNRKLPKASVFSYFESNEQFGCGAAVQHSYIDSEGNLYPCDFVPLSYGNVFENPIDILWQRMHESIGKPRGHCFSKVELNNVIKSKNNVECYPLKAKDLCIDCKCINPVLPAFYRILKGEKV